MDVQKAVVAKKEGDKKSKESKDVKKDSKKK